MSILFDDSDSSSSDDDTLYCLLVTCYSRFLSRYDQLDHYIREHPEDAQKTLTSDDYEYYNEQRRRRGLPLSLSEFSDRRTTRTPSPKKEEEEEEEKEEKKEKNGGIRRKFIKSTDFLTDSDSDDGRFFCFYDTCEQGPWDREDAWIHHTITAHPEEKSRFTRRQIRMYERYRKGVEFEDSDDEPVYKKDGMIIPRKPTSKKKRLSATKKLKKENNNNNNKRRKNKGSKKRKKTQQLKGKKMLNVSTDSDYWADVDISDILDEEEEEGLQIYDDDDEDEEEEEEEEEGEEGELDLEDEDSDDILHDDEEEEEEGEKTDEYLTDDILDVDDDFDEFGEDIDVSDIIDVEEDLENEKSKKKRKKSKLDKDQKNEEIETNEKNNKNIELKWIIARKCLTRELYYFYDRARPLSFLVPPNVERAKNFHEYQSLFERKPNNPKLGEEKLPIDPSWNLEEMKKGRGPGPVKFLRNLLKLIFTGDDQPKERHKYMGEFLTYGDDYRGDRPKKVPFPPSELASGKSKNIIMKDGSSPESPTESGRNSPSTTSEDSKPSEYEISLWLRGHHLNYSENFLCSFETFQFILFIIGIGLYIFSREVARVGLAGLALTHLGGDGLGLPISVTLLGLSIWIPLIAKPILIPLLPTSLTHMRGPYVTAVLIIIFGLLSLPLPLMHLLSEYYDYTLWTDDNLWIVGIIALSTRVLVECVSGPIDVMEKYLPFSLIYSIRGQMSLPNFFSESSLFVRSRRMMYVSKLLYKSIGSIGGFSCFAFMYFMGLEPLTFLIYVPVLCFISFLVLAFIVHHPNFFYPFIEPDSSSLSQNNLNNFESHHHHHNNNNQNKKKKSRRKRKKRNRSSSKSSSSSTSKKSSKSSRHKKSSTSKKKRSRRSHLSKEDASDLMIPHPEEVEEDEKKYYIRQRRRLRKDQPPSFFYLLQDMRLNFTILSLVFPLSAYQYIIWVMYPYFAVSFIESESCSGGLFHGFFRLGEVVAVFVLFILYLSKFSGWSSEKKTSRYELHDLKKNFGFRNGNLVLIFLGSIFSSVIFVFPILPIDDLSEFINRELEIDNGMFFVLFIFGVCSILYSLFFTVMEESIYEYIHFQILMNKKKYRKYLSGVFNVLYIFYCVLFLFLAVLQGQMIDQFNNNEDLLSRKWTLLVVVSILSVASTGLPLCGMLIGLIFGMKSNNYVITTDELLEEEKENETRVREMKEWRYFRPFIPIRMNVSNGWIWFSAHENFYEFIKPHKIDDDYLGRNEKYIIQRNQKLKKIENLSSSSSDFSSSTNDQKKKKKEKKRKKKKKRRRRMKDLSTSSSSEELTIFPNFLVTDDDEELSSELMRSTTTTEEEDEELLVDDV